MDHCDEDHDHAQDDDHDEEGLLQGVLGRSWGPLVRLLQLSSATLKPPQERSNTKQKVDRTRHPHFSRMYQAKASFSA